MSLLGDQARFLPISMLHASTTLSLRVRPKTSFVITQVSQREADGGEEEEGERFVVEARFLPLTFLPAS
jgi:hypothetical protein